MKNLPKGSSGQVLLVILLVMFVGLTISLALLSRTTTDIKLSRDLEESSRAFSAAEAGIEEALRGVIASTPQEITTGVSFNVTSQEAGQGSGVFSLGKVEKENVGTVWFVEHDADGNLVETAVYGASRITLCWKEGDTTAPQIEAIVLYKDGTDYKVARRFYNPSGISGSDDCDDAAGTFYPYKTDVDLPTADVLLALRLKPIGGSALLAVDPPEGVANNSLPSQGREIISTGKAGGTVRKIKVIKSYPSWPEIFDYVLFSGGGLSK